MTLRSWRARGSDTYPIGQVFIDASNHWRHQIGASGDCGIDVRGISSAKKRVAIRILRSTPGNGHLIALSDGADDGKSRGGIWKGYRNRV